MPRPKKPTVYLNNPASIAKARQVFKRNRANLSATKNKVREIAKNIEQKFIPPLMEELKRYPEKRSRSKKVDWTSEAQRKKVMWLWKKRGIKLPHPRSNELAQGWEASIESSNRDYGIRVTVDNKEDKSQFVVGKVGFRKDSVSIRKYEKPIQRFHKDRWKPAHRVIQPYVKKMEDHFDESMNEWYAEIIDLSGMDDSE